MELGSELPFEQEMWKYSSTHFRVQLQDMTAMEMRQVVDVIQDTT